MFETGRMLERVDGEVTVPPFDGAISMAAPFPHAVFEHFLSSEHCNRLLGWLETTDVWRGRVADEFYNIEEAVMTADALPPSLRFLLAPGFLHSLRRTMSELFGRAFQEITTLRMHKLARGCRIRVHTDFGTEPDTHRLVIHLNRGWDVEQGGILMFLDERHLGELHDDHRYYVPAPGLAVAFEISSRSHHAVTEVMEGERYTLCYSFRAAPGEGLV